MLREIPYFSILYVRVYLHYYFFMFFWSRANVEKNQNQFAKSPIGLNILKNFSDLSSGVLETECSELLVKQDWSMEHIWGTYSRISMVRKIWRELRKMSDDHFFGLWEFVVPLYLFFKLQKKIPKKANKAENVRTPVSLDSQK